MTDAPRRVAFTDGHLLTAADLRAEQEYHRRMRYLHNRLLHGYGVADGFHVDVEDDALVVRPGLGLDPQGRELLLTVPLRVDASAVGQGPHDARDLLLTWAERADAYVPGPDGTPVPTRWLEQPEASLARSGEAGRGALLLGRVTRDRDGSLSVDGSLRRRLGGTTRPGVAPRRIDAS